MEEKVILVNDQDQPTGLCEKMEAHKKGLLHRAFSIFIFNSKNQMLIHKRAKGKYHSGGLWTNACCSHPREHETIQKAAHRRLREEFGFDCELQEVFSFTYKAVLDKGLQEHEFDHVLLGRFEGPIDAPNPDEIEEYRWIDIKALIQETEIMPEKYTIWFLIALKTEKMQQILATSTLF